MDVHKCADCGFRMSASRTECPQCGSARTVPIDATTPSPSPSKGPSSRETAQQAEIIRLLDALLERQRMAVELQSRIARNTTAIKWGLAVLLFWLFVIRLILAALGT